MLCKLEQESLSRVGRQFGQPLGDDYVGDPVSEAAITGAALVRHLDDVRFATLRALRQLLRALDAERIAIGLLSPDGERIEEELVWVSGFGRCGESERVVSCAAFSDELRTWLATQLVGAVPARAQAAQAFGMGPRTFARRLQQENLHYSALVDGERRQLACAAVADSTRSFSDIAQSLGFAEASVFHRAFKRWTGYTPGQWRSREHLDLLQKQ